ncbi:hypothetical protein SGFS_094920 [Streptomyces graminofaciens]|uniref:UspA domain-containing protein n=1 Tax=Streptomyces graminofaciens TaxID=68212 RepID=A0ABN5VXX1_9ACTN|nr:universal stress protein [Streptomyces graminofaciens]BBC38198.1 hypothetical protein SGFS_094920 [Streptomyces graminofaciens]
MPRTVTVGVDASRESLAAAEWAAREARLRRLPLRLVNVWEPVPEPMGGAPTPATETPPDGPEPGGTAPGKTLREAADGIRLRHPGLDVTMQQLTGRASEELAKLARDAELLALGSRGLSGIAGFLVGSVGQAVVAHAERPVVLVRAGERTAEEHVADPSGTSPGASAFRPVVLGLDIEHPDDTLIGFAFEAAALRATSLRVVHDWAPPPYFAYDLPDDPDLATEVAHQDGAALTHALRPWRQRSPSVEIVQDSRPGKAADHLVDASHEASLVVVGRRVRRSRLGTHIGPVTHAVLHHAAAPVAVVAHE